MSGGRSRSRARSPTSTAWPHILFALMVAVGAGFVHFVLFQPNGLLWSLVLSAPATPLLNRLLPGARYGDGDSSRGAGPLTRKTEHLRSESVGREIAISYREAAFWGTLGLAQGQILETGRHS